MACVTPEILFYSSSHIGFSTFYQTEVTASETCDFQEVSNLGHLRVTVTNGEKIFFKELIKNEIRWQCYYILGLLNECTQLKYRKNSLKKLRFGDAGSRTRGLSHAKRTLYRWATSPTYQCSCTISALYTFFHNFCILINYKICTARFVSFISNIYQSLLWIRVAVWAV